MNSSIAYISASFPLRSETFVYREVRALRAAGFDVRTVSLNAPPERGVAEFADLEAGTIVVYGPGRTATVVATFGEWFTHPVRAIGTVTTALGDAIRPEEPLGFGGRLKLVAQAFAGMGLARRLRAAGVRHLHCHFAHAPTTVGMYAARQLGIPFTFTGHANDLFQRRALLRRKLERAAAVACISEWHRSMYEGIHPDGVRNYHVIRCGVDVDAWVPKTDAGRTIDANDPLRVLTVCRLVEKKGVDTLLRGLAAFGQATGQSWRLVVAGDGPERMRLEALAGELDCSDRVEWLGAVGNDRVRELLAQADVFCLPCREDSSGDRDGIPVVLIEAMACGVPVVSGDLPAIRELVRPDLTGLLIDAGQVDSLTAALTRLVTQRSLRSRLAHDGRKWVESEFALLVSMNRIRNLLLNGEVPQVIGRNSFDPFPAGCETPVEGYRPFSVESASSPTTPGRPGATGFLDR